MKARQASLFEDHRLRLQDAIDLSLDSLREYGRRYKHWATAYSGGKDSSATTTFIAWAINEGHVPAPETWTVLLSDTRLELPPLISSAMTLINRLRTDGVDARVVMPPMDDRFFVYMFGRGVPPPKNRFR
ncbi:MAG: FAD synthetase, partial [Chloroflexi bacterium]|nr:FAD synthetase [Chloroflexota bacterium]